MSEDPTAVPAPLLPPRADPPFHELPGNGLEVAVDAPDTKPSPAFAAPTADAAATADAAPAAYPAPTAYPTPTAQPAATADAAPAAYPAATADAAPAAYPAATADAAPAAYPAATADAAPTKPKRRRLHWLWWAAGSLAFASLAGLCAYLAVVADQWSGRVDDLTAISQDLGTQVADQTAARKTAEAQAAELQSQLDTATTRITTLANEEANANDHESVWIDLVDAMIECEQGWVNHSTVLKGKMQYTDTTTAKAEAELIAYCDGISNDYTSFKAEIGK